MICGQGYIFPMYVFGFSVQQREAISTCVGLILQSLSHSTGLNVSFCACATLFCY